MAQIKKIKVDASKVQLAIRAGIPLTLTTYTLPHAMEEYICEILKIFLEDLGQNHMVDSLTYCIKELVNNAKKANTKRIYFQEKGLDINNFSDYEKGMKTFKQDTLNNIRYYMELQRRKGYYIKVSLQTRNNKIKIEVRNRAELTVFEYKRIHDKITRAQQYSSVEDGLVQLLDESEGAGLGLVIMILVLRKIGLTEENFQVKCENGETITRLILPFSAATLNDINALSTEFVNLIDGLPEFDENIMQINRIIDDPKSKMSDIAMKISNDVSLTAELLKMVNSAAYVLSTPCSSIGDAVKIAGIRGIRNLLFSIGTMHKLTVNSTGKNKEMWDHSYREAFYAYNIARNFCAKDRGCVDDSYVCGLLHDMGKIIFENAMPDVLYKINSLCTMRGIEPELFERMISGVNHGELGAKIAQKWNFPQVFVDVIRYHHEPAEAPENVRKLTSVIYVADIMTHYEEGKVLFEDIDSAVLKTIGIEKEEQFHGISEKLSHAFRREK